MCYLAKFEQAIYVLHAFEKRTRKTSTHDVQLARQRYQSFLNSLSKVAVVDSSSMIGSGFAPLNPFLPTIESNSIHTPNTQAGTSPRKPVPPDLQSVE